MISDTDSVRFAPGVALDAGHVTDQVRGAAWPLNRSGTFVLERMGLPVGTIIDEVAEAFSLPGETARADVLEFVWHLNTLALVNIEDGESRLRRLNAWVQLAAQLAPAGALPAARVRRRALDTTSVLRAVVSSFAAILPRLVLVAALAAAAAAHVAAIVGSAGLVIPLGLGLATGIGLGLHEAAHAALLRGVPSALVTRGRRTYVLHASVHPSRRSAVALAGPLVVAGFGICCVLAGALAALPLLALVGCPLAAHALALTAAGGDGRVVCGL